MHRILFYFFFISFLLIGFNVKSQGQNKIFEHITITDGLPQSTVYTMLQDNKGYLWFGTQDKGLCKYDGYTFKLFNHNPYDDNSISSNRISMLIQDSSGIIWIGTWGGGLNKLDTETEKFTVYKNDPDDPTSISHNKAQVLFIDKSHNLWIGTAGGGLCKYIPETETFENYRNTITNLNSISNDRLWSITQDNLGYLWIGTDNGLNKFDPVTGLFEAYFHDPDNKNSLSDNQIRQTFIDNEGVLWIGTAVGLDKFIPKSNHFEQYVYNKGHSKNSVNKIYEDKFNKLWLGTHIGGLLLFDKTKKTFIHYTNDPENKNTISYNDVRDILHDNTDILWISTRGGGINKLDLKPQKFEYHSHNPKNPNSLLNNRVRSIHEDKNGILWIGTDIGGGLNKFDRENNTYTHYVHNKNDPTSLVSNDITVITEDNNGYLWLGTDGFGIDRFDQESGTFKHFKHDPGNLNSLCYNIIWDIQLGPQDFLWIGTNNGLDKFDPVKEEFTHYKRIKNNKNSLSNTVIWAIYHDSENNMWIGTDNGLNLYIPETDSFKQFVFDPDESSGLQNSTIYSIHEDQNNTLWIGTELGLHKFNKTDSSFSFFPEDNIKVSNAIFGILSDDSNNLWLSTVNGLTRFNISTNKYRFYNIYDGLQNNDFSIGASYKSRTGELIFGGVNGFNIFYPDSVRDNPYVPPLVITDFKLFNKSLNPGTKILMKTIDATDVIKLKYNENVFSIGFSALNYTKNKKNQYACKLEGFDEFWVVLGNRRSNHYTNIPPGDYIFKVRGSNNDGVWNNKEKKLRIIISPPFWKTTWFIIIGIAAAILIILGIIRIREKSLILSKKELEEIVRARTLELSDQKEELESALSLISKQKDGLKEANIKIQETAKLKEEFLAKTSHELRTPLNVIVGFANLLLNESLDLKHQSYLREIKTSTDNLLVVIDDILTFSKIESGKLNIEIIEFNIEETIETIFNSFKLKANEKGLDFTYYYDDKIPVYIFGAPVRLNQIISNLIDNAIKFTDSGGKVKLELNCLNIVRDIVGVEITVSDTGIGMELKNLDKIFESFTQARNDTTRKFGGTGLGLSIVKKLIDMLDGEIKVESKIDKGTKFIIHLDFEISTGERIETNVTNYIIDKNKVLQDIKILLVEDNPINTILATDTIKLYNPKIKIDNAENGKVAIDKIPNNNYDLIILDIQMPVMDGYETAKYIRNEMDKPHSEIPILAMSAHALKEEEQKCLSLGMNAYISKPFIPDDLFNKIDMLTSKKHFRKQPSDSETNQNNFKYKYFNLKNLETIYGNNNDKIVNIVNICLTEIPHQLSELKAKINVKDFKNMQIISHSLKTSLNYLGLESLTNYAQEIENQASQQNYSDKILENYNLITEKWRKVKLELQDFIKENGSILN